MAQPNMAVLAVGSRFNGRYEIVRCLKSGGMGAVYEVLDQKTRRRRALKIMLPAIVQDPDLRARFKLEATITADVESDHIVETFDADIDLETGSPFLVMELLKGEDLSAVLAKRGKLPADEGVLLLGQVALALDKTHAAGIVHRDLKPENLFLTRADDGSPRLKVLDFGIAKVIAQSAGSARTTRVMGTPLYMPKEQIIGDASISAPADIYALGHIAFTLLVGEAYWSEEQRTAPAQYVFLTKVMQGTPELATARAARRGVALPSAFDAWFAKATALDSAYRFDQASAMIAALATALDVRAPRRSPVGGERDQVLHAPAPEFSDGIYRKSEPSRPTRRSGPQGTTAAVSSDRVLSSPSVRSKKPLLVAGFALVALAGVSAVALRFVSSSQAASGPVPTRTALAEAKATTGSQAAPSPGGLAEQAPKSARSDHGPPVPSSASPEVVPSVTVIAPPTSLAKAAPSLRPTTGGKTVATPRATPPSTVSRPAANRANDDPTHIR
jgi:eukaryotic-like serine/threonine-protein kinase